MELLILGTGVILLLCFWAICIMIEDDNWKEIRQRRIQKERKFEELHNDFQQHIDKMNQLLRESSFKFYSNLF